MRLIRTSDMMLEEFPFDPPPYAILSHTWGTPKDEVLFEDMTPKLKAARAKAGFHKIEETCRLAEHSGLEYCWIDTCCIDKRSSAELQEAINSMFRWYILAEICVAYLADVSVEPSDPFGCFERQFRESRWFTRGWTLQELIAPREVTFFNQRWNQIGSKRGTLSNSIATITGIPNNILSGDKSYEAASIAQRMSWASRRITSRKEDIAYCLLGLFSVNMAMLYGEGDKAFIRLQQEILNSTYDETIFAWCDPDCPINETRGLLAEHPRFFSGSGHVLTASEFPFRHFTNRGISRRFEDPPVMTGRGLRLRVPLFPFINILTYELSLTSKGIGLYIMPLQDVGVEPRSMCGEGTPYEIDTILGIILVYKKQDGFTRLCASRWVTLPSVSVGNGGSGPYTVFAPQKRRVWEYGDVGVPCEYSLSRLVDTHEHYRVHMSSVNIGPSGALGLEKFTTFVWFVTWMGPIVRSPDFPGLGREQGVRMKLQVQTDGQNIAVLWLQIQDSQIGSRLTMNTALGAITHDDYYVASLAVTRAEDGDGWKQMEVVDRNGTLYRFDGHIVAVEWDPVPKRLVDSWPTFIIAMWEDAEATGYDQFDIGSSNQSLASS